jgi:hypothetical protein
MCFELLKNNIILSHVKFYINLDTIVQILTDWISYLG